MGPFVYSEVAFELDVKAVDTIDTIYQIAWAAWRLRHLACPPAPEWMVLAARTLPAAATASKASAGPRTTTSRRIGR